MVLALAMPTPNRAQKNMKAFAASPERTTMAANTLLAQPMIGMRRMRSVIQPMGSAPSTTKAADELAMKVMAPSPTPKVSRMSGASTVMAAVCNSSRPLNMARTRQVAAPPPMRSPSRSPIPSDLTPGSSSSANRTSGAAWRASRRASSSRTVAASSAAFDGSATGGVGVPDPSSLIVPCPLSMAPDILAWRNVGQHSRPFGGQPNGSRSSVCSKTR